MEAQQRENAWLEVSSSSLDAGELMERIDGRLALRGCCASGDSEDPLSVAKALRRELIEETIDDDVLIGKGECDIVPRNYAIDWRVPILGPIHAAVRRVINAEIRRYLMPSLQRQSYINRQLLRVIGDLIEENKRLHREVEKLRKTRD